MPLASARSLSTKRLVANYDPYSAYLDLALPFDARNSIADISARIKGGGIIHATHTEEGAIDTSTSKFYGASFKGGATDSSTRRLWVDSLGGFGSSDFCIETYFYAPSPWPSGYQCSIFRHHNDTDAGLQVLTFGTSGPNPRAVWFGPGAGVPNVSVSSDNLLIPGAWNHIAVTRSGSTLYIFINGTYNVIYGGSIAGSFSYSDQLNIINSGGSSWNDVRLQDYRIYKGTPKYTANFTPPGQMIQTP